MSAFIISGEGLETVGKNLMEIVRLCTEFVLQFHEYPLILW